MKTLPSSQFRVIYAALTEPVVVTVVGRPIGTWTPTHVRTDSITRPVIAEALVIAETSQQPLPPQKPVSVAPTGVGMTQAERDAVLRRMTK